MGDTARLGGRQLAANGVHTLGNRADRVDRPELARLLELAVRPEDDQADEGGEDEGTHGQDESVDHVGARQGEPETTGPTPEALVDGFRVPAAAPHSTGSCQRAWTTLPPSAEQAA